MSDFEKQRDDLTRVRAELEQKRAQALLAREALRRAESSGKKLEEARRKEQEAAATLADARARADGLLGAFAVFTDPREQIANLPDASPILLFPLRLETRFKTSAAGMPQLWVRIYPDSCLIDTFEPSLTEREVANTKVFWEQYAVAAGDEALERDAWRALVTAHGAGRAGWIIRQPLDNVETRRTAWSSAARIELLPERFVVVAYPKTGAPVVQAGGVIRTPLAASPDPNAPLADALRQVEDQLHIPADMAWMFDFDKAVQAGMALRVDITAEQARAGFERLIVLGVRMADTAEQGRDNLARLLEHQLHSRAGLEILPQGTPTNNTEKSGAGYTFRDDPDATFDIFVRQTQQYAIEPDPLVRRDGRWLAELLSLPHELVQQIPRAGGTDQSDARAMQIALWPGTLGYMMKTLLAPVFSDDDVDWTRGFFTRYVSGRGPLPVLRIGRQPYGILPAASFSALTWAERQPSRLQRLHTVLQKVEQDWKPLVEQVSYIGKAAGDPHQRLLDVLGLHPTSVEYYPLVAESLDHKFHEASFFSYPIALSLLGFFPAILPLTLLRSFGYTGEQVPDLFNKMFKARQTPLTGPLIDDRPLSETQRIRDYAGDMNYIEWLADAARTSIQAIQEEQGFDDGKKPTALLYLLLRHALQLGFFDTSLRLHIAAGLFDEANAARREPAFVHVAEGPGSESRYDLLFRADPRVTNGSALRIGDYIARNTQVVSPHLGEQTAALDRLSQLPTATLERVFAEHVDCCAYRLDAWKTGLLLARHEARQSAGLFLGAFGWVEQLRPKVGLTTVARLPDDLATPVNRREPAVPLMRDATNGGLIHAPSINHATTAAVLRNGYLANDGRLAVNITSRRVRLALDVIDGMRNGQSLGALLGYQLERHVHDNGPLGVRDLVYHLRRAFPLAANQITSTNTESGEAQDSIAAMNVVDGRKLIEHVEGTTPPSLTYPFGVATLPSRPADQEQAVTDALAHIRNINDAIADLVLTEGVHQAVLGNYERSAGVLDAFAKGNHPPEPDVIRTPRTGIGLTLRSAIHLSTAPDADPIPGIAVTPLARAEPAVNVWLRDRLPPPEMVGCNVTFTDRASDAEQTVLIDQRQLALQSIDLLYRVQAGADQALGDVDDLIVRHVQRNHAPRHDHPVNIQHSVRVAGKFSWFELQALLRSMRALLGSRPLRPADLMRANDATTDQQGTASLPRERVEVPRDELNDTLLPALDTLTDTMADTAVSVDVAIDLYADTVAPFAAYRLPQTGTGFVYEWRASTYTAVTDRVRERVTAWNARLTDFDARLTAYDAASGLSDEERFTMLAGAELLVSTEVTLPRPADPADYRNTVLPARRAAFVTKRDELEELYTGARATLAELLDDVNAALPLGAFDVKDFEVVADEMEVERFRLQLSAAVAGLKADVIQRVARVDDILTQHDAAAASDEKARLLTAAGKILFADDFQFVPQITLPPAAAMELANAWLHSTSGKLTEFLTTTRGRDFPVDDWLHGVARVREKMRHWENVALLGDAIGVAQRTEHTPLQLPYDATDPWLALEFPEDHEISSDRLLYTAHFAEPFDAAQPICGLLVDEWTEVIPGTQETSGIAFHYDRPNSEAPQSWLLALPATQKGAWSWDELLGAVNDALDSAKRRAIEPTHIDATAYSWFLPATMSPYTFPEISISNNLLRNRAIYEVAGGPG